MAIFDTIYAWLFEWLFGSQVPAYLSAQGVELVCIAGTIIIIVAVLSLVLIPLRKLISACIGG